MQLQFPHGPSGVHGFCQRVAIFRSFTTQVRKVIGIIGYDLPPNLDLRRERGAAKAGKKLKFCRSVRGAI